MPSTSNVALSGNDDIDGVLSGVKWASAELTYSFPTSSSQYNYSVTGFSGMNPTQVAYIQGVLRSYAAVANLTFTEVTETSSQHGTIRFAETDSQKTAEGYYPGGSQQSGDVWFNHADYNDPVKGSYAGLTMIHEIGHTLGLDHGQDGIAALPTAHDSMEFSVMTYRSYVGGGTGNYTVAKGSYAQSPMLSDIAALQYMYGANYRTNAGDTVYRWNASTGEMSIDGVGQGRPEANKVFLTVWDGGGDDTYDFSNYRNGVTVDLRAGGWSTTSSTQLASLGHGHSARGTIANAYLYQGNTASLIENANGGSGGDRIVGNELGNVLRGNSGNDTLTGLGGNDTIIGGSGSDTYCVSVKRGDCLISYDKSANQYVVLSSLGRDVVSGVETFRFADKTIAAGKLDLVAPRLTAESPAKGDAHASRSAAITLTFNESLKRGDGHLVIHNADGTVVETIGIDRATVKGSKVTVDPSSHFAASSSYYVTLEKGALTDLSGNGNGAITSATAIHFTTESGVHNGNSKANTITGGGDADTLNGNGGNDRLTGNSGNDSLNGGSGKDTMTGGWGDDTFKVDSAGDVVTEKAGQGNDTVVASISYRLGSNLENLVLTGSARLSGTGNDNANSITGNDGDNTLAGGLGKDTLTGGAGADHFVFNTALSNDNVDRVADFTPGTDKIVLDHAIFAALAIGNLGAGDFANTGGFHNTAHITYNRSSGALFYDHDGYGGDAAVQFAALQSGLTLSSSDFTIV